MNLQNRKKTEKTTKVKFKLQEWQKWLAAISSSLLIVLLILGIVQWLFQSGQPNLDHNLKLFQFLLEQNFALT